MDETFIKYSDYRSKYKGILMPEDSFKNFAIKASSKINYFTFDRINIDNLFDWSQFIIVLGQNQDFFDKIYFLNLILFCFV